MPSNSSNQSERIQIGVKCVKRSVITEWYQTKHDSYMSCFIIIL